MRKHTHITITITITVIITIIETPAVDTFTSLAGPGHGVDGTCAARSAAILDRPIIWLDHGLTTGQMRAVRQ